LEEVTREEALALLEDRAPRNRLRAARALQAAALAGDFQALRDHIDREPDGHVRRALLRVVHRIRPEQRRPEQPTQDGIDESQQDLIEDVWAEATEEITTIFVHEISPVAGAVAAAARSDLGDAFESSATARTVGRLRELVEHLTQLCQAAEAPEKSEFDLTDLVVQMVNDEEFKSDDRIRPARDDPVVIIGAGGAVRIGLANGLRNAVEAVDGRPDPQAGQVVINWGVTDRDAWISVLDDGVGLPESFHRAFDFGMTSKPQSEHFGFGLSISKQAMISAGGSIELTPRDGRGAAFVMRWPLDHEPK
jgi:signal transduction histidine kinase